MADERATRREAASDLTSPGTPTPDRDPAEYGPSDDSGQDASETTCRACGSLAIDHTPGRFSVYGVCPDYTPPTSTPEAATERCEHVGCQHPMHFEDELQRATEQQEAPG